MQMSTTKRQRAGSVKNALSGLTAGAKAHEDQAQGEQEDAGLDSQPAVPQPADAPLPSDGKAPLPADEAGTNEDGAKCQAEAELAEAEASFGDQEPSVPNVEAADSPPQQHTPEQPGKESLPDEEGQFEGDEDFEDEDEEAEPVFSAQDRADLPVLEGKVKHHGLEEAKAIREIRQRKLWILHRNEDGTRKYRSYDEYVQEFFGRSRQWASEQTQWLAIIEKLAELRVQGLDVPEVLTRTAVSGLHHLVECGNYQGDTEDEQEEAGLILVLQEAAQDGVSFSGQNLRAICDRRYHFYSRYRWRPKPLAPTYEDYKRDLALVEPLGKVDRSERNNATIKEWAEDNNATMQEAVLATYKKNCSLPDDDFLLSIATGDDLNKLVDDLVALGDKIASLKEAEQVAKDKRQQARQVRESLGLPKSGSPKSKRGGEPSTVSEEEEAASPTYSVELTGDFAEALGWSAKDEVSHEDLLNLFETLAGKCSPLTVASSIIVQMEDEDEEQPEEVPQDGTLMLE
jgi:hypothetical protein